MPRPSSRVQATAMSWLPSLLRSPAATERPEYGLQVSSPADQASTRKLPVPLPKCTARLEALADVARSKFPSPLKSAATIARGFEKKVLKVVAAASAPAPSPSS